MIYGPKKVSCEEIKVIAWKGFYLDYIHGISMVKNSKVHTPNQKSKLGSDIHVAY